MSADLETEPIPGLPRELPPGEEILWQGSPQWRGLARHTFKLRWLAFYFAVLLVVRVVMVASDGSGAEGALSVLAMAGLFALSLGLLALGAWLHARATIYTITTRRVVMRMGIALSMSWNLPFKRLAAADLALRSEDDGDVVLALTPPDRIRWVHLWPHVEPRRFLNARPALRCLAEPERVAKLLGEAVSAWAASEKTLVVEDTTPATEDAPQRAPAMRILAEAS